MDDYGIEEGYLNGEGLLKVLFGVFLIDELWRVLAVKLFYFNAYFAILF